MQNNIYVKWSFYFKLELCYRHLKTEISPSFQRNLLMFVNCKTSVELARLSNWHKKVAAVGFLHFQNCSYSSSSGGTFGIIKIVITSGDSGGIFYFLELLFTWWQRWDFLIFRFSGGSGGIFEINEFPLRQVTISTGFFC